MENLIFQTLFTTFRPGQYANVLVEVVASKPSLEFFKKYEIEAVGARVWTDEDEWTVSQHLTTKLPRRSSNRKCFTILGGF